MISCKNCGGKFKKEFSYCPYCGHMNELSARKNFLKRMKKVTEDLEKLPDESKKIYESEIKKEVRKTKKMILIIGAVIAVICCLSFLLSLTIKSDPDQIKKEIFWEREYFPVLDQLYEKKDYQGILDFMEEHYDEPGECYYRWEHYEFLNLYADYQYLLFSAKDRDNPEQDKEEHMVSRIYSAAQVYFYEKTIPTESYGKEQAAELAEWKETAENFFITVLDFTKEEIAEFEKNAFQDGYLSFSYCKEYAKHKLKKN